MHSQSSDILQTQTEQRITRSQTQSTDQMADHLATPRGESPGDRPKKGSAQFLSEILEELKSLRMEVKELRGQSNCQCKCQCQNNETGETNSNVDGSVTRLLQNHSKIWKDSLQKRKIVYYNKLKNDEKADIRRISSQRPNFYT